VAILLGRCEVLLSFVNVRAYRWRYLGLCSDDAIELLAADICSELISELYAADA
jgi:hypothetical protein